jgi:hypothetical protein
VAHQTPSSCRQLVIYEIYVRNHGPNGTFADVETDLARIRSMGVDVLWLMPIHPIGHLKKKGGLGSPYAVRDYRGVNPEYGTHDDLRRLLERAHANNLRVIIDIVFNHTAPDSNIIRDHPDWIHNEPDEGPYRAWTDIVGLKHSQQGLRAYLIETLLYWANFGVDGFRCDVASLLPKQFWLDARQALDTVRPDLLWLAETLDASFLAAQRQAELPALADCEVYDAFDITYDYDIWPIWLAAVKGQVPVNRYLEMLRYQECVNPANYVKLRFVENHDGARIMKLAPNRNQALAWTAFSAFNKGAWLIYAGQESGSRHMPSLFDIDKVEWGNYGLQPFLASLAVLKKDPAQIHGRFVLLASEPAIQAVWHMDQRALYGIFNVRSCSGETEVFLPDGVYEDVLSHDDITVNAHKASLPKSAAILCSRGGGEFKPFRSKLLDSPDM